MILGIFITTTFLLTNILAIGSSNLDHSSLKSPPPKDSFKVDIELIGVYYYSKINRSHECKSLYKHDDVHCTLKWTICAVPLPKSTMTDISILMEKHCNKENSLEQTYDVKPQDYNDEKLIVDRGALQEAGLRTFTLTLPPYNQPGEMEFFLFGKLKFLFRNGTNSSNNEPFYNILGEEVLENPHDDYHTTGISKEYKKFLMFTMDGGTRQTSSTHYGIGLNMKVDCEMHLEGPYCNQIKSVFNAEVNLTGIHYHGNPAVERCKNEEILCAFKYTYFDCSTVREGHTVIQDHCINKNTEHLFGFAHSTKSDGIQRPYLLIPGHFHFDGPWTDENGTIYHNIIVEKTQFISGYRNFKLDLMPYNYTTEKLIAVSEIQLVEESPNGYKPLGAMHSLQTWSARHILEPGISNQDDYDSKVPTQGWHNYVMHSGMKSSQAYMIQMNMKVECNTHYYGVFCNNWCDISANYTNAELMMCDKRGCNKCIKNVYPSPEDAIGCGMKDKFKLTCSNDCRHYKDDIAHNCLEPCGFIECKDGYSWLRGKEPCVRITCTNIDEVDNYEKKWYNCNSSNAVCKHTSELNMDFGIHTYLKCVCNSGYSGTLCGTKDNDIKPAVTSPTTIEITTEDSDESSEEETTTAAPPPTNPQPQTAANKKSSSLKTILIVFFTLTLVAMLSIIGYFMYKKSRTPTQPQMNCGSEDGLDSEPSASKGSTEDNGNVRVGYKAAAANISFDNPTYPPSAPEANVQL